MMSEESTLLKLVRRLGVEVSFDWDEELLIDAPELVPGVEIAEALRECCEEQLVDGLRYEARRARRRCHGGPLDGQPHGSYDGHLLLVHMRRGEWHGYYVDDDGRARYAGQATSERKVRGLVASKFPHCYYFGIDKM